MQHQVTVGMPWPGGSRLYESRRLGEKIKEGDTILLQHGILPEYTMRASEVTHHSTEAEVLQYVQRREPKFRREEWNVTSVHARYISEVSPDGITIISLT